MPKRAQRWLAVIFVFVAVVCARLGVWQLARLHERQALNATVAMNRSLPVVILGHDPSRSDSALANRRVIAVGRYDYDREIVLRGQVFDGVPGVHAVTPLRLRGSDTAVLINRGFVPAPDAVTVPPLGAPRDTGLVRIAGIALPISRNGDGRPITHNGRTSWARLDVRALRDSLPYPILGVYIRRTADTSRPTFPAALAAPALDNGSHLNYALQWFGFAILAIIFAGIVWWKAPEADSGPARADEGEREE